MLIMLPGDTAACWSLGFGRAWTCRALGRGVAGRWVGGQLGRAPWGAVGLSVGLLLGGLVRSVPRNGTLLGHLRV
jgi:hypothetical protein